MATKSGKQPAPKPKEKAAGTPLIKKSTTLRKKRTGFAPAPSQRTLRVGGKKVAAKSPSTPPVAAPSVPAAPAVASPEPKANERPLCWIELVKSGNVFVARSNTHNGVHKEYKNRVLEDMLTELIVELQEEIQE